METENEVIDCVETFENFYQYVTDEEAKKMFTKEEFGYIWLCSLFTTFYDYEVELKWGKLLYDTIVAIIERKQIEMINRNYEEYLICLNLIGTEKLNWGSSIRFCWFDTDELKNKYINYLKQINYKGETK